MCHHDLPPWRTSMTDTDRDSTSDTTDSTECNRPKVGRLHTMPKLPARCRSLYSSADTSAVSAARGCDGGAGSKAVRGRAGAPNTEQRPPIGATQDHGGEDAQQRVGVGHRDTKKHATATAAAVVAACRSTTRPPLHAQCRPPRLPPSHVTCAPCRAAASTGAEARGTDISAAVTSKCVRQAAI